MAEAKTSIAEYVASNGTWAPVNNDSYGVNLGSRDGSDIISNVDILPAPGVNGQPIYIVVGVYESMWGGTGIAEFSLVGTTEADGSMSWVCQPGDETGATAASAVELQYLPANCRG